MTIFVVAATGANWLPVHYSPQGKNGGHVGAVQHERIEYQADHLEAGMLA